MPISLTQHRRDRLSRFLQEAFESVKPARDDRIDQWRKFLKRYEAKTVQKNFPWRGASSIHIPLVAIVVDQIKARILNALFGQDRIINVEPLSEEPISGVMDPMTGKEMTWRTIADLAERYLAYEISNAGDIDFKGFVDELLDDMLLLGTSIPKVVWETTRHRDYLEDGTFVDHTVYDNIRLLVPSLEDYLFSENYPDFSRVPFVTQIYRARPSEIRQSVVTRGWNEAEVNRYLRDMEDRQVTRVSELSASQSESMRVSVPEYYDSEIELAETWLRFDLDGNGRETRILVDHPLDDPTRIFRVIPWPYEHGRLPFVPMRYIRRRKQLLGMGIPERLESLDEGLSTVMNQVIDNVTAANTRLWKVRANSPAMRAMSEIWPNKRIPIEDADDISPLELGEVYPSAFEILNILKVYADQTAKLTEYNLGRESQALGRQSTATGTLALLQESGQYHDSTTRDLRFGLNEVLQQMLDLIAQHQPLARIRRVLGRQAEPFLAALRLPYGDLRSRVAIRVAFSSTASTRELARQEEMAKMQLLNEYYQGLVQLGMLRFSPETPLPVAALTDQIAESAEFYMRKLLETFGEPVSTVNLPSWTKVMQSVPPEPGPGTDAEVARNEVLGAAGLAPSPGMEAGGGVPEPAQGSPGGTTPTVSPGRPSGEGPGSGRPPF